MSFNLDLINGFYELVGSILVWLNVYQLYNDKEVKGINWKVQAFFSSWGFWNIIYYGSLDQWYSQYASVLLAVANAVWVVLAWRYKK